MTRLLGVALLAVTACQSTGDPAVRPESKSVAAPNPQASAKANPCVEKCVMDNQMRAESADKIEADCRNTCANTQP